MKTGGGKLSLSEITEQMNSLELINWSGSL
jgi:hypothetical protein